LISLERQTWKDKKVRYRCRKRFFHPDRRWTFLSSNRMDLAVTTALNGQTMILHLPRPFPSSMSPQGIVFTDLDGTLFCSDRTLSATSRRVLEKLPGQGIVRVVATGRSLASFLEAAGDDFPADYVTFSTGAGVASLKDLEILKTAALDRKAISQTVDVLRRAGLDFMLHHPIPENHRFAYESRGEHNPDFMTRIEALEAWGNPLTDEEIWEQASQFVAIIPPWRGLEPLHAVRAALPELSVIRATSPFDHQSTWVEIFPANISKSHAARWLCDLMGVSPEQTMAVGNDYNDLDLLEMSPNPFVVANAPEELARRFPTVPDNDHDGAAMAITAWSDRFVNNLNP
jgi:hypothetical protein